MNIYLLAHAGEVHETAAEAAQHESASVALSASTVFWITLIVIPIVLFSVMQLFKMQLSTKLLVFSTFLIIFSVVSYQAPGPYSVVSLVVGFATVFTMTIIGLTKPE